jgi:twitching motility protein PilT
MKPIDDLLSEMMARNASDLHIKAGSPPVIRVDGELVLLDEPPLTPEDTKDVAASIMTDKQIRRFSEHNEIDFAYSAANLGRFRVNVFRQRGSISVAMRQVTTKIPTFEELHLPEIIKRLALEPRGLVLVTGTTGSGKTTTLAMVINLLIREGGNRIITVEEPIEYWEVRAESGESVVITGRKELPVVQWLRQAKGRPVVLSIELSAAAGQ